MKKLGVVVPYRNRPEQLNLFLESISTYLDKQSHEIIVVDQQDEKEFNRGKLLNVGFLYAVKLECDYVVFHDIDMLPIDVDYSYSDKVTHLISDLQTPEGFDRDNFDEYFGGVTLFPVNLFYAVNGYTNEYWGWGFEDDNLMLRCREVGIKLDKKKVVQKQRDGIGLQFNGKNSFVVCPNIFNNSRDYTILTNFTVDKIEAVYNEITDIFSIFSIPGRDTTLTYNSFRNFSFQFWNKSLNSLSINSEHYPEGTYTAAVVIKSKKSPKYVELYINGVLVKKQGFDNLMSTQRPSTFYLGVGDPDRKSKNNYFCGSINNFLVYNSSFSEHDIKKFHTHSNSNIFNLYTENPLLYYDGKFVNKNKLVDLSGNNKHGRVFNTTNITTSYKDSIEIDIPIRRKGVFKAISHKENGYVDGYWVSWKSRENQLDYYRKYYSKNSNYKNDGLTTTDYQVVGSNSAGNYHHIKVQL